MAGWLVVQNMLHRPSFAGICRWLPILWPKEGRLWNDYLGWSGIGVKSIRRRFYNHFPVHPSRRVVRLSTDLAPCRPRFREPVFSEVMVLLLVKTSGPKPILTFQVDEQQLIPQHPSRSTSNAGFAFVVSGLVGVSA